MELAKKLKEIKELKAMAEELQAEIDSLQDEIKAHMVAAETDTLHVDVFKVTYKEVTSTRFDSTAFKKTYGELYKAFTKQTASRRFSISN